MTRIQRDIVDADIEMFLTYHNRPPDLSTQNNTSILFSLTTYSHLQVFEIGRSLITDLKLKLSDYSKDNDAVDKQFMQGYTFNSGFEFLNHVEVIIYNTNELQNIFTRIDQNNKHLTGRDLLLGN